MRGGVAQSVRSGTLIHEVQGSNPAAAIFVSAPQIRGLDDGADGAYVVA